MGVDPVLSGVMVMMDNLSYQDGAQKGLEVGQRDHGGQERKETLVICGLFVFCCLGFFFCHGPAACLGLLLTGHLVSLDLSFSCKKGFF